MDTMLNALAFLLVLLLIIEKTESQEYGNAVPTQGYLAPTRETNKEDEYYEDDASYSFRYNVEDPFAGNYYGHYEERDGDHTAGGYNVLLPDGRHQKVSYTVSGDSGFVAQVEYEGVAKFYSQPVRHDAIASHGAFAHSQSFSTSPGDPIHTELLPTPQALTFSTGNVGAQQTHKAGVFAGTAGFDAGSVSNLNALGIQNSEITSAQHIVAEGSSEVGRDDGIVNAGASSAPSEGIHTESQTGSGIGTFALDAGSSHATSGGTEFPGDIVASSFSGGHFGSTGSPLAAGDITDGLSLGQAGSHDSSLSFGSPGSIPVGGNTFVGHTETSIIPAGVQLNVDHSGSGGNLGLISQSPGVTVIPVRETSPVNNAFVTSHEVNSGTGFDVRSFEGFVPVLTENGGQGFLFSQALNEGSGFEVQQPGIPNQLTNVAGLSDIGIHAGGLSSIALTSGNTGFVEGTSNQFTVGGANILGTRHSDFNIVPIYSVGTDLGVTNELSTVAAGGNTGFVEGISNQLTVGGANILGTRHSDFNIVPIQSVNTDLGVTNELSNVAEGGNTGFVERTSNLFTVGGANILGTRHSDFNIVPIHGVGTDLGVTNELSNVAGVGSSGFEIGQVGGITNLLSNGGASFGVRPSSGITVAEGTGSGPVGGATGASLSSSSVGFGVSPSDGLAVGKGIRSNGFGFNLVDDEGGSRSSDIRIGQVRGVTFAPLSSGDGVTSEIGASQETESTLGFRESQGKVDSVGFSSNHIDEISSNQGKNLDVGHSVSNTHGKSNSLPSIDVNAFTVAPEPVKTTDNLHTVQEDSPNQLADIDTSRTALHTGTAATGHFNQVSNSGFQQPNQLEVIDTSRTALHTGTPATGQFSQVSHSGFQQPSQLEVIDTSRTELHTGTAATGHFNQVSNSGFQQPNQLEVIDTSRTALHTGKASTGHFNQASNSDFQQPNQLEVIDTSRTALHTGTPATGHFNQVSNSGFQQPNQLEVIDTSRTALHTGKASTGHFNQTSNSDFQQPNQLEVIDTSRTALHTRKASTGHFNQASNSGFQQPSQLEVIDTSRTALHTGTVATGHFNQASNSGFQQPSQLEVIDTSTTALHTGTAATGHFNQASNSGFQQPNQLEVIDRSRTALHTGKASTGHFNQASNSGFQQPNQLEVIDTSRTALHTGKASTGHFNQASNSGFQQPSQLEVIDTSRTALHTGTAATGHFNQASNSGFQQPSQLEVIDTSTTALHTGTAATGHFNQASNSGFQQPSQLADIDTSRTALHTGKASTGHFNQVSNSDFQQPSQLEVIDTSRAVLHTRKAAIGRIHQVPNADFQHLHLQPQTELGVTVINFGSDLSHENLQPLSSHSSFNNNHIPQGAKAVKAPTIIAATLLGDDISGPHEAILRKLVDGALKGDVGSHPDIRVVRVA